MPKYNINNFLTIKPLKKINSLTEECEYEIPCHLIKIGDRYNRNSFNVTLKILGFDSGIERCQDGIIYEKSIDYFKNFELLTRTFCLVRKAAEPRDFVIYGNFNTPDLLEVHELSFTRDHSTMSLDDKKALFYNNYKQLRNWAYNRPF